jgi:hypothetical protein
LPFAAVQNLTRESGGRIVFTLRVGLAGVLHHAGEIEEPICEFNASLQDYGTLVIQFVTTTMRDKHWERLTANPNLALAQQRHIHFYYNVGKFVLGSGAYSTVKIARHETEETDYAVKIMDKSRFSSGELIKLIQEFDIVKSLRHPNIVQMKEVFDEERELYLVMEYIPGGDLFDFTQANGGHLTESTTHAILSQMLDALEVGRL